MASKDRKEMFTRPSVETIQAYLLGHASDAQRAEVIAAMAASSEFRDEMHEMAEEIDELSDQDRHRRIINTEAESVPKFRKHLLTAAGTRPRITNIWKVLAPVAAAAVLLLALVPMFMTGGLMMVDESVDPALLMSLHVRGAQDSVEIVYDTPKDAALAAFRSILEFADGRFRTKSELAAKPSSGELYTATLQLTNNDGAVLHNIEGSVPLRDGEPPSDIQVWLLTMPDRQLFSAEMSEPVLTHEWEQTNEFVCVVFTYAVESGYRASAPRVFTP